MKFQIVLCKNHSIGSWFLRFVMGSRWSHSAVYDVERGLVYDTTLLQGGCKVRPAAEFFKHYPYHVGRPCEVADEKVEIARNWLEAQVGKRYDWTALVGFVFRRNWQEDDSWFCSEHSETFRATFSQPKLRLGLWRVTPHHQDILV